MRVMTAKCNDIPEMIAFVESALENSKLTKRDYHQALLISEEVVAKFQEAQGVKEFKVTVSRNFGEYSIRFVFPSGSPFELTGESEDDIGGKILNYYGEKIKLRYRNGMNTVTILASQSFTRYLRFSAIALVSAMVFSGMLFLLFSEETRSIILEGMIWPVESIFAKAVCMLATPVTFFCIVSNIASYSNLMDRYPDVRRVILRYIATSMIAVVIGYLLFLGLRPLAVNFETMEEFRINSQTTLNFSTVWNALEAMVPDNVLSPFTTSNTLPMLFLAVISGFSVGIIDRQSGKCRELMDMICNFFCKMLYIVFGFSSIMIFFCFTDIIIYNGWVVLPYLFCLLLAIVFVLIVLNLVYVADLACHRIAPRKIYRTMRSCFRESFLIGSSVDAIPNTLRHCTEELELPKRPLEVSIPLGANMNMDGNCATLMFLMLVVGLINGVDLSLIEVIIMGLTILVLSLGAPNQPGSMTVAAMVLLPQLGLTQEVMTMVILIELLTCRILAASNVLGDIVCSKIIGERERRRVKKHKEAQR